MSSQTLEHQIVSAKNEVEMLRRSIERGNRLTVIAAGIMLAVMCGYFYYGYTQIAELMQPKLLVPYIAQTVDSQLPLARESLQAEIEKSAPEWAENLSSQLISAVPSAREALEKYVLSQTQSSVELVTAIPEPEMKRLISEHREVLEDALTQLSDEEELPDEMLNLLMSATEAELQSNLKKDAGAVLHTLGGLNDRLAHLKAGSELTPEETIERRIIMIIRKLQSEPPAEVAPDATLD